MHSYFDTPGGLCRILCPWRCYIDSKLNCDALAVCSCAPVICLFSAWFHNVSFKMENPVQVSFEEEAKKSTSSRGNVQKLGVYSNLKLMVTCFVQKQLFNSISYPEGM